MKETEKNVSVETESPKTVKIKLPLTKEKQADVFVGYNGQTFLLQRGVEIEVPEAVYEILQNSEEMDSLALTRQKALHKQF